MKNTKYIIISLVVVILMASFSIHAQELPNIPTLDKPISQMTIPELQAKIEEIIEVIKQLQRPY